MVNEKRDVEEHRKERLSLSIIDYKFTKNRKWIYRRETGQDVGCDCTLELVEGDNTLQGKRACCQVKGRTGVDCLKDGQTISFDLEVTTYNMAVNANYLFLLLLVDLQNETIYFKKLNQCGQKSKNQSTVCVHIPTSHRFPDNEELLIKLFNGA